MYVKSVYSPTNIPTQLNKLCVKLVYSHTNMSNIPNILLSIDTHIVPYQSPQLVSFFINISCAVGLR